MEGKLQGDISGNVYVEFDCNNIILVDPNKVQDNQGNISERLIDHENLVMYANLEAELLPRTKLAVGGTPDSISVVSIAKIDFTKGNKDNYLTTGYYDELTGLGTKEKEGTNQLVQQYVPASVGNTAYTTQKSTVGGKFGVLDTGLLGITNINIKISGAFIPTVSIDLEDVQGRALFQLGENSPYAAFFHLPYPPFYLTIKGYYGQAIKYQLNLEKFAASFDSMSGNYKVKLILQGYKFNILNEISMGSLIAVPHMYSSRFDITNSNTSPAPSTSLQTQASQQTSNITNASNNQNSVTTQMFVEKGYQKIHEVYQEYKSDNKRLLDKNFPELTLQQLIVKLETFEKNIIDNFSKTDVEPLTNIRNYTAKLNELYARVYTNPDSFFSKYLNQFPFVEKDTGIKYYALKESFDVNERVLVNTNLEGDIKKYNEILDSNPTLGKGGKDKIENKISMGIVTAITTSDRIDWIKTAQEKGILNPTIQDIEKIINDNSKLFKKATIVNFQNIVGSIGGETPFIARGDSANILEFLDPTFYVFQGTNRFIEVVQNMLAEANKKLSEYETKITNDLKKKIEDPTTGIGFTPTVRNIVAIIMASAEAFLRLLDETHTKAWAVKDDPVRKNAILKNPSSVQGSDTKLLVQGTGGQDISKIPVYPWPQFFYDTGEDKKGKFQLRYIADPSVVNLTQGYLYDKWPEVEFVEEYIKGLTKKVSTPTLPTPSSVNQFTKLLNINAIEFPQSDIDYTNKEEVKFFFELYERQILTSRYTNYARVTNTKEYDILKNTISEIEKSNLINSLGASNPYLNYKLKNFAYNSSTYPKWLKEISNGGTGQSYIDFIKDKFVTEYLDQYSRNSFSIISTKNIGATPSNKIDISGLEKVIKSSSTNEITILDTYPFTDDNWVSDNLHIDGQPLGVQYNTSKVIQIFPERNVISNFSSITDTNTIRPVTNFSFLNVQNPLSDSTNTNINSLTGFLPRFYSERLTKNFIPTEGYCFNTVPTNQNLSNFNPINGDLPLRTTTSILNTPIFINAILEGVKKTKQNNDYPFTEASYLFINSLPLISPREKYKSNGTNFDELDYMFATFKKFGAIHKLPYAWILKIGSLWYRYKLEKEKGVDLLNSVWKDFDYKNNFDPQTGNPNRSYILNVNGSSKTIQCENNDGQNLIVQSGFFPKVINDFNYFYKGSDLYNQYDNSEIQSSLDNGLKLYNFTDANIITNQDNTPLKYLTWSVLIPNELGHFVVPSFGSKQNQVANSLLDSSQNVLNGNSITGNTSVYNGSVRALWAAPNYGYFDISKAAKPLPDSYMNEIRPDLENLSPFIMSQGDNFTKIEDIFSVFDKNILDSFETEFKNFSKSVEKLQNKPESSLSYGGQLTEENRNFVNFQLLFRALMRVESMTSADTMESYFNKVINQQLNNFSSIITSFLNFDILFRYGNPSNYDRYFFDSFLLYNPSAAPDQQISVQQAVENGTLSTPKYFGTYVKDSLPTKNGTTTLSQSKLKYPTEWMQLELSVGFSTITDLVYGDNGSYITDFFVDNNIKFDVDNIKELSAIIKMYATQKLKTPTITPSEFKNKIKTYFDKCNKLQNDTLNQILESIRKELPDYQEIPAKPEESKVTGTQSKVDLWESFKAMNDKWIAGNDYKTKTFFEDILFLDRASRNIGDTIYLDIFSLKETLSESSMNFNMSVYTFIAGLLIKNNFTIMNLPAYVNFYNVENVNQPPKPNSLKFADDMWGTHTVTDYTQSGPKMVCFFVGRPSNYVSLPESKNYLFRSDGLTLDCSKDNPLYESNDKEKHSTEYKKSNKCVGFTVDIGIRNQNVFSNFTISQDNGKGTAESVQTLLNMINQASGRETATQNVSLYNYYAQRSYGAQIICLGNAMIQPTMYFNLRHVPMFNGPYLITEVTHTISPGSFQTSFTGTRQGVFDLPPIDSFLQSINQNLLTRIEQTVLSRVSSDETPSTNQSTTNSSNTIQNASNTKAPDSSCKIDPRYTNIVLTSETPTITSVSELISKIKKQTTDVDLQSAIFSLCYLRTYLTYDFQSVGNNYASVSLIDDRYISNASTFIKTCTCKLSQSVSGAKLSLPVANFSNIESFIKFMIDRLTTLVTQIKSLGIHRFYITKWQEYRVDDNTFKNNKDGIFNQSYNLLNNALTLLSSQGITPSIGVEKFLKGDSYTPPPTPTPSPQPPVGVPSTDLITLSRITVDGNDTKIIVKVAPNVGLWKITDIAFRIPSTAPCDNDEGPCGAKISDVEWTVSPYQYAVDSCTDGNLLTGEYNITFLVGLKPILPNGQPDRGRGNGETKRFLSTIRKS